MKRVMLLLGAAVVFGAAAASIPGLAQTGNGAPSGTHYNLNIIGVTYGKIHP